MFLVRYISKKKVNNQNFNTFSAQWYLSSKKYFIEIEVLIVFKVFFS